MDAGKSDIDRNDTIETLHRTVIMIRYQKIIKDIGGDDFGAV